MIEAKPGSASRKTPLYVEVAEAVEGAILRGEYGPGDRLPTERALAREHGVNPHTAGHALGHLQTKGLVYRVERRGTFVRPGRVELRAWQPGSFLDSLSRSGLAPNDKIVSVRRIGAYGNLAALLRVSAREPLVVVRRVRHAGEIPLAFEAKSYREDLFPGIYELLFGLRGSTWKFVKDHYGVDLQKARSTVELEPADTEVAGHLGVTLGTAVLKVQDLSVLEDGTPARWNAAFWRGDATRVEVRNRAFEGGTRIAE